MRSRMSIIPRLVNQMWEQMERPHRLLDQHFGSAMAIRPDRFFDNFERQVDQMMRSPYYYRPWITDMLRESEQGSGWSMIKNSKDKFHVALDVQQFKPEEVQVKLVDNCIVVEGKHEEKSDEHGTISRHFIRKYAIPDTCDPEKACSTISSDGILEISAPVKPEVLEKRKEKVLKIEKTGKPALENKKEEVGEQEEESKKRIAQSQ